MLVCLLRARGGPSAAANDFVEWDIGVPIFALEFHFSS